MADFAYRPGTSPSAPPAAAAAAPAGGPPSPTGRAFAQRFPVYQIDFTSIASGKVVSKTKRRIRWYVRVINFICFVPSAHLSIYSLTLLFIASFSSHQLGASAFRTETRSMPVRPARPAAERSTT